MRRRFGRAGLAALSISLLLTIVAAGTTSAVTGTNVISGWKNGPVAIHPGTDATVATLKLPSGNWLVWAKLFVVHDPSVGKRTATCSLGPSTALGQVGRVDVGEEDPDVMPSHKAMALQAVIKNGRLSGNAVVRCHAQGGDGTGTTANWIKIMALQLGTLNTFQLTDMTQTTVGSGNPTVVYATRSDAVALPDNATQSVGQLSLTGGSWYVRASFTVTPNGLNDQLCKLVSGGVDLDTGRNGSDSGGGVVSFDAVVSGSGSLNVSAKCTGNDIGMNAYGNPTASNIRYSAVRIGTLVTINKRGGQVTTGRGTPKLFSAPARQGRAGELEGYQQINSLSVPAGKYLFFANISDVSRSATCELRALPDYDAVDLGAFGFATPPLLVVHSFAAAGKATINCTAIDADFEYDNVHLSGLQLNSLTNVAL